MATSLAAVGLRCSQAAHATHGKAFRSKCFAKGSGTHEEGTGEDGAYVRKVYSDDAPPLNQVTYDWVNVSRDVPRQVFRAPATKQTRKKTRSKDRRETVKNAPEFDDFERPEGPTAAGISGYGSGFAESTFRRNLPVIQQTSKQMHRFNTELMRMTSTEEILEACSMRQWPRGDGIAVLNVVSALECLAQVVRRGKWHMIERLQLTRDPRFVSLLDQVFAQKAELKPRGLARLFWSLANLGGVSKFKTETEMLVRRADDLVSELLPRDISNITWALATTKHRTDLLSKLAHQSVVCGLSTFKAKELCSMIWAFGSLNYHPGEHFIGSIPSDWTTADQLLIDFTSQQLTNCLWGLAILKEHDTPQFRVIWEEVLKRGSMLRDNKYSLLQIHQVLLLDGENGIDFASISDVDSLSELRNLSSLYWEKEIMKQERQVSFYQRQVADVLRGMGVAHVEEDNVSGLSIDVSIPARQVAIEVDGPSHMSRTDEVLLGHTVLKQMQLQALGWHPLNIPYYEWDALIGREMKRDFLLELLEDV